MSRLSPGNEIDQWTRAGNLFRIGQCSDFLGIVSTCPVAKRWGKNQAFDVGSYPLNVATYNHRAMTIEVSSPWSGYKPATYSQRTLQNMWFETVDLTRNAAAARR